MCSSNFLTDWSKAMLFEDHFVICVLCLSAILSCPFLSALWSAARKELIPWLYCMRYFFVFFCVFVTFPYCVLSQVWYLIVLIPDICLLPCFQLSENRIHISEAACKALIHTDGYLTSLRGEITVKVKDALLFNT